MSRKFRRPAVQLTSLLDLLFVMVFLSLLQTKSTPPAAEAAKVADSPKVEEAKPEAPKAEIKPVKKKIPITATFHFYATARNPEVPTGTYAVSGTFNRENGRLQLSGEQWIKRPEGYDMVPLTGRVAKDGKTLTGRIEFPDCKEFTLRKTSKGDGQEIAGKWEGSYVCFQGETGLTLTIH
jgi:hypothetical protein